MQRSLLGFFSSPSHSTTTTSEFDSQSLSSDMELTLNSLATEQDSSNSINSSAVASQPSLLQPSEPTVWLTASPSNDGKVWHDPTNKLTLLSREEKHRIITLGPCQPNNVVYPKTDSGGNKRCFQAKWFSLPVCKEWLEYSPKADAMFCFACRIFATQNDVNEMGWIVNSVRATNWKNATRAIKKHNSTCFHVNSMKSWKCYLEQTPIDCLLNEQRISELSR